MGWPKGRPRRSAVIPPGASDAAPGDDALSVVPSSVAASSTSTEELSSVLDEVASEEPSPEDFPVVEVFDVDAPRPELRPEPRLEGPKDQLLEQPLSFVGEPCNGLMRGPDGAVTDVNVASVSEMEALGWRAHGTNS